MKRSFMAALAVSLAAGCSSSESPTSPDSGQPPFYAAIGASDGIGFGSSSPCVPFAECPNGTGYVQILLRTLRDGGEAVGHRNLSLPGGVLSRAIEPYGVGHVAEATTSGCPWRGRRTGASRP